MKVAEDIARTAVADIEFAWAVGLFEGEGCIHLSGCRPGRPGYQRYPQLILTTTDRDVAERFAKVLRANVRPQRQDPRGAHWKIAYRVTRSGRGAEEFLTRALPLLGARRAARAREVLGVAQERRAAS